jgi:hypothetical protein
MSRRTFRTKQLRSRLASRRRSALNSSKDTPQEISWFPELASFQPGALKITNFRAIPLVSTRRRMSPCKISGLEPDKNVSRETFW